MRDERSEEASESVISSNPRVLAAISGSFRASGSGAGLYLARFEMALVIIREIFTFLFL